MKASKIMKAICFILIVCMLLVSATACKTTTDSVSDSSTDESKKSDEMKVSESTDITRDNTLVWTVPGLPAVLDIYYGGGLSTFEAMKNVYGNIAYYPPKEDPSGFLVPDFDNPEGSLAEKLELSSDGKTLTVKLREGVISHTGNELVADDFIWERNRQTRLVGVENWQNDGMGITDPEKQIKKIDKYTFSITTEKPNPILLPMMTHTATYMIDSKEYEAHEGVSGDEDGTIWSKQQGSGHGPYKVESFNPGDNITFVAHDEYFESSLPKYFEKVIMKEVPKSANRLALVLNGDVDVATYLTPKEITEAKDKPGVKVMSWKGNFQTRIEFNVNKAPFDEPLVRKALGFAVPYEEILDTVYLGTATQLTSVIPSSYPAFTDEYFKYNLDYDEAKKLLAEAGYPDGFDTTLTIMAEFPVQEQIAIIVKDSMKNIGVNIEIEKMQSADFWSQGPQQNFKGMYVFDDMPGLPDMGFSTKLWLQSGVSSNFSGYSNAEVDRLYKETTETVDTAARAKNFKRIQEITVWEDPAWILLAEPGYHLVLREEIEGLFWQSLQEIKWAYAYRNK